LDANATGPASTSNLESEPSATINSGSPDIEPEVTSNEGVENEYDNLAINESFSQLNEAEEAIGFYIGCDNRFKRKDNTLQCKNCPAKLNLLQEKSSFKVYGNIRHSENCQGSDNVCNDHIDNHGNQDYEDQSRQSKVQKEQTDIDIEQMQTLASEQDAVNATFQELNISRVTSQGINFTFNFPLQGCLN
jgi:hypothetical protein